MNKTELIEKIAAGAGLSKADAKKALDATVAAVKDALVAGDKIDKGSELIFCKEKEWRFPWRSRLFCLCLSDRHSVLQLGAPHF